MLADVHLSTPVPGTKLVSTQRYSTAYENFAFHYASKTDPDSRTAAFYWGYLVGVLPMALILRRFPLAKSLSFFIFVRDMHSRMHAISNGL
jgi:hypothetical protein